MKTKLKKLLRKREIVKDLYAEIEGLLSTSNLDSLLIKWLFKKKLKASAKWNKLDTKITDLEEIKK